MRKLNQLLAMRYEDSGKNISPAKAQRRKAPRFGGFVLRLGALRERFLMAFSHESGMWLF